MKFKTSITHIKDGKEIIRGHALEGLVREHGFSASVFLLLKGTLPNENELKLFDAMLTSVIDHGPGTPSALNARISASAKNSLHASVAAGLLGLGERHGTAVSKAMEFFYRHAETENLAGLLKEMKARKEYVAGYGHKMFEDADPRTETLFALAAELGLAGKHADFAKQVEETLNKTSSKKLPLNADGAIAALLCDMGFDSRVGDGVFVIGRVPGLVAHIVEEVTHDEGIRRIPEEDIVYE